MSKIIYPIGAYAPGFYGHECELCGEQFLGDKYARQCEPCAIAAVNEECKELRYRYNRACKTIKDFSNSFRKMHSFADDLDEYNNLNKNRHTQESGKEVVVEASET